MPRLRVLPPNTDRERATMFSVGQEIANRFRLTQRLGGSEAAPVWLALDRDRGQAVVLKFRPNAPEGRVDSLAALSDFSHQGIARPAARLHTGTHSLEVFEFAAHGDLSASRGRPCETWLPRVKEVAAALEFLHSRGLVHGDVKAANVLIDATGRAMLADMDTLKAAGAPRSASDPRSPLTTGPQQRAGDAAQISDDIYSYGAMLYELLCAVPPGYADQAPGPTPDAAIAVIPVHPAPAKLIALTQRCLASHVDARPASMAQTLEELDELEPTLPAARAAAPILTPPAAAADVIQPRWQRSLPAGAPDARQLHRQGFRQGMFVAAAVALAALAVLLFALPARHAEPVIVKSPHPSADAGARVETVDLQVLARAKSAAEARREILAPRIAALQDADALSWDAAGMSAALTALAQIDALMTQRDYVQSGQRLDALAVDVARVEAGRRTAMDAALQRGRAALQRRDSSAASAAFAAALKIDAGNTEAQRGARRAANQDAVLVGLARAGTLEQGGRLQDAATEYRRVLALDAETSAAQTGLAQVQSQLAADQFGQALAQGYAALGAGRNAAARTAFDAAQKLRPDDPELARAQHQLAASDLETQLTTAVANARAAENKEQWLDASKFYQQALALDGTLVEARTGLEKATSRAQLDRELQLLVAQPERTYSPAVYTAGSASLRRAQAIASPEPMLARQIAAVTTILQKAEQPVTVVLHSDGQTSVTVFRIGELGTFAERSLQLKPGRYVVAGTRSGYRDVRRELNVLPDVQQPPLLVQCTEHL